MIDVGGGRHGSGFEPLASGPCLEDSMAVALNLTILMILRMGWKMYMGLVAQTMATGVRACCCP